MLDLVITKEQSNLLRGSPIVFILWLFTYIYIYTSLFYVLSYTCISVTVIVYAIYIYVILFTV